MSVQIIGAHFIFGIPEKILPVKNKPEGKIKWRFRGGEFAFAICRDATGHCRWAAVQEKDGEWILDFNVSPPTKRKCKTNNPIPN